MFFLMLSVLERDDHRGVGRGGGGGYYNPMKDC